VARARRFLSHPDVRDPVALIVVRIVGAAFTALTTLLIARLLDKAAYGDFALVTGLVGVLVVAVDLGLTSSLARFVAEGRVDRSLLMTVVLVRSGAAVVAAGMLAACGLAMVQGWLGAAAADGALPVLLQLGGAMVVAHSLLAFLIGLLPTLRSIRTLLVIALLEPILGFAGVVAMARLAPGAAAYMSALIVAAGVASGIGFLSLLRFRAHVSATVRFGTLVRYSVALLLVWVIMAAFGVVDQVLLKVFRGSEDVASYALGWKLIVMLHLPALAVATIVAPRLVARDGRSRDLFGRWLRAITIAYVGVAASCAATASEIFPLIGEQYRGDALVFVALSAMVVLVGIAPLTTLSANFLGGARRRLRLALLTLVANVALDILLIPRWGPYGAAFSSTLTFAVYVLGHVRLVCEHLGMASSVSRTLRSAPVVAVAAGACAAAAYGVAALSDDPAVSLALALPAALTVYAVLTLPITMRTRPVPV
jgi:O-antigen/teichoic acid export membrane protein